MQLHRYIIFLLLLLPYYNMLAQTNIDSLLKIITLNKKDTGQVRALNALSLEYARTDVNKAKEYLYAAFSLASSLILYESLSASYSQMVNIQMITGKPDSALYYLDLLKQLSSKHPASIIQANYYFTAGLFYKVQGNYKGSLPYAKEALRMYTVMNDKTQMAGQNLNIGNSYLNMSDIKSALPYHLEALRLFEEINNKRGQSFCLQGIGTDFIELGQYKSALPYIQRAINIKKELNDKRGITTSLMALGQIYDGLGDYDKALSYEKEALLAQQELKLTSEEAKTNFIIGKIYVNKKDAENAAEYFNKSKTLALQVKDSSLAASADAELTVLQVNIHKLKATEKKFFSSLKIAEERGDNNAKTNMYQFLSNFYAANKQYDKALEYNEKYHSAEDSTHNNELQGYVKKLEQQYNLEKKEKEIALLKKDQQISQESLQRQKIFQYSAYIILFLLMLTGFFIINGYRSVHRAKRKVELEQMRNNIARNLHDDIGSTLTSINILSKVALQQIGYDIAASASIQKIKDRSSAIMESMNDIVWAINPANDALDKIILRMKEFGSETLEQSGMNFTFMQEGELNNVKLSLMQRNDLYLIFKEALNNAIKHSKASEVNITLKREPGSLILKITDDGKGFDSQQQMPGNGLKNMHNRMRNMNASFQMVSAPGSGTTVYLNVPLP